MARKSGNQAHTWIFATTCRGDEKAAEMASRSGRTTVVVDTTLDVLDVYCERCRRTYDDVAGRPCEVAGGNEHLIGGPTGLRRKRIHDHDCRLFGCLITPEEAEALRRAAAHNAPRRVG
jgi:hypothetical protein